MREFLNDLWRLTKLTLAVTLPPLLLWGLLVWTGVLR